MSLNFLLPHYLTFAILDCDFSNPILHKPTYCTATHNVLGYFAFGWLPFLQPVTDTEPWLPRPGKELNSIPCLGATMNLHIFGYSLASGSPECSHGGSCMNLPKCSQVLRTVPQLWTKIVQHAFTCTGQTNRKQNCNSLDMFIQVQCTFQQPYYMFRL
jgi:hypothetical protein